MFYVFFLLVPLFFSLVFEVIHQKGFRIVVVVVVVDMRSSKKSKKNGVLIEWGSGVNSYVGKS